MRACASKAALKWILPALACAALGFVDCSTHVERPAEEPEETASPPEDEGREGFSNEEIGQLDELLDGGVSASDEADGAPSGESEP